MLSKDEVRQIAEKIDPKFAIERQSTHESRLDYEQDILRQGHNAVNSILRDWIKGQVTAIESGILSFEEVFLPHLLTADGRRVIERVQELLPKPADQKIVALPSR
jgi:hypothetical protein